MEAARQELHNATESLRRQLVALRRAQDAVLQHTAIVQRKTRTQERALERLQQEAEQHQDTVAQETQMHGELQSPRKPLKRSYAQSFELEPEVEPLQDTQVQETQVQQQETDWQDTEASLIALD